MALSNLLGAISSANILLETSNAKTISTPSLLTVSNLVPIFGFTKEITTKAIAIESIINFKTDLKVERSGFNLLNKTAGANCFCFLFFHQSTPINKTNIAGIISK